MNSEPVSGESAHLQARIAAHRGGRRRYALAAVLLLAALAIGAVIGAGAAVIYMKEKRPRPPSPDQVGEGILRDMSKMLPLDDREKDELRRVVIGHMNRVADIRKKSWDDIRDQFDAMQDDVVDVLGPERYEKWESERDKRMGEKKNLHPGRGYDRHRWRERYDDRHHGPRHRP
jgi:hypothetical protein